MIWQCELDQSYFHLRDFFNNKNQSKQKNFFPMNFFMEINIYLGGRGIISYGTLKQTLY